MSNHSEFNHINGINCLPRVRERLSLLPWPLLLTFFADVTSYTLSKEQWVVLDVFLERAQEMGCQGMWLFGWE